MAIHVKKRYDARQNVAAWGLGLEAWGFFSLFLIPDPIPWDVHRHTQLLE